VSPALSLACSLLRKRRIYRLSGVKCRITYRLSAVFLRGKGCVLLVLAAPCPPFPFPFGWEAIAWERPLELVPLEK